MISCYKKCYIHTLLVYSCPLHELISGHYQICANDISPLSLIGCICGTVIQNLYPLIGTSKKKKPNCSKSRKQLVPSSSCHRLLPLSMYPLVHTHLHVYNSLFSPNLAVNKMNNFSNTTLMDSHTSSSQVVPVRK